jgi:4-hydroxybenzoate polyprenyltransferase
LIFFKRFFDFLLFGNIYVAIGTVCLIQSSVILTGAADHLIWYSMLSFSATLFIYNLQRIFYTVQKDNSLLSKRRKWISENQFWVKSLCITGLAGVAATFFLNDHRIIFYLSPLLLLSIAYFLPAIKLRQNILFKLLTLAFVWTTVTAIIPTILNHGADFSTNDALHFFSRFIFMIAICIPFDIRDLKIDQAENISTLTHKFGEQNTRMIALGCMFIYFALIVTGFMRGMFPEKTGIALMTSAIINAVLVFMSNSKRGEYFYIVLIDGTMILQGIALMIAQYL